MTTRFFATELDLEVESLFLEILYDPRARLFRAERAPQARAWILPDAPVGPHAPSLTKAERKLLASYREEMAFALRHAYLDHFLRTTPLRSRFSRYVGSGVQVEIHSQPEILAQLEWAERDAREAFPGDPSLDSMAAARRTHARLSADPTGFLHASGRLAPHGSLTGYLAYEALNAGRSRIAEQLFAQARDTASDVLTMAGAASLLATMYFRRHEYGQAQREYSKILECIEDYPSALLGWLVSSLQGGDWESASQAARIIIELWGTESREVQAWADDAIVPQVESREWLPTQACHRLLPRLRDSFGGGLDPIVDALVPSRTS